MKIKESKIVYIEKEIPIKSISLTTNKNILRFIKSILGYENSPTEYLIVIALDNAQPVAYTIMGNSAEDEVSFSISSILRFVILSGCQDFITIHNHPNGSPEFSKEDIESAKATQKAAKIIGLRLVGDYLIAGDRCFKNRKLTKIHRESPPL